MSTKTQVIIPSAGIGKRLGESQPKPLIEIAGKPIFIHTLEIFDNMSIIDSIILVVDKDNISQYEYIMGNSNIKKVYKIIIGGNKRCDSVLNGLKETDGDTKIVLIHDSARPIVSEKVIKESINLCVKENAVVVAVPVKQTIKRINADDMYVESTLDRSKLWEIQTPQVFKRELFLDAYENADLTNVTDDASLVEQLGYKVGVVRGEYSNIKITTQEDLKIAEMFLKNKIGY